MTEQSFDILVIGGGINGAGVARDAAGRGYSVCLAEAGDFASGTSSASTKLIHGGLRYLEHYEFRLVREALKEREVLWATAPHIVTPMRFVLPVMKGMRPAWLLRLGLFLYDHIGGRKLLPATRTLNLADDKAGRALKPGLGRAFEYSDAWVDDARLVILNARDAAKRGAQICARTRVMAALPTEAGWQVELRDEDSGTTRHVSARAIVNAAGPWVDHVLRDVFGANDAKNVRLVRGSHIVVPRISGDERAYFFQQADGRIIFAIPYETDFTLIGTTDADHGPEMAKPEISKDEIDYLCEMASVYFRTPVTPSDVVWTYSGVRPLYDDGASAAQEATRDYVIREDGPGANAPLLNIFGGKITTYRRLAESVMGKLASAIGPKGESWSATAPLPGGDFAPGSFEMLCNRFAQAYPFLGQATITRLTHAYGTEVADILGNAEDLGALGRDFGAGLYEAELRHLASNEWARNGDDVLWRRSKLGLHMDEAARDKVARFMETLRG